MCRMIIKAHSENRVNDNSFSNKDLLDTWVIQTPRDLRRTPAQSCVLSWMSYMAVTRLFRPLSNQALKTPQEWTVSSNTCLFLQRQLFLAPSLKLSYFNLCLLSPILPTMHHCEKPGSVFLITLRDWRAAIRSMLSLLFSRWHKPSAPHPPLTEASQPFWWPLYWTRSIWMPQPPYGPHPSLSVTLAQEPGTYIPSQLSKPSLITWLFPLFSTPFFTWFSSPTRKQNNQLTSLAQQTFPGFLTFASGAYWHAKEEDHNLRLRGENWGALYSLCCLQRPWFFLDTGEESNRDNSPSRLYHSGFWSLSEFQQ